VVYQGSSQYLPISWFLRLPVTICKIEAENPVILKDFIIGFLNICIVFSLFDSLKISQKNTTVRVSDCGID
jgi:hypothetical protein